MDRKEMMLSGGHSGEAIPVPIPNTEVKLSYADDTDACRERRLLPDFFILTADHMLYLSSESPLLQQSPPPTQEHRGCKLLCTNNKKFPFGSEFPNGSFFITLQQTIKY